VVRDSLGNMIEVERLITVRCEFYEFRQFKEANLGAQVPITSTSNGELAQNFHCKVALSLNTSLLDLIEISEPLTMAG